MCMILSKEGIDAIEITGGKMREKKENERIYYKDFTYKVAQNIKTPVIIGGGITWLTTIGTGWAITIPGAMAGLTTTGWGWGWGGYVAPYALVLL